MSKIPPINVDINNSSEPQSSNPPDLVNLKVSNPIVYIKYWWKKIMANEGMEMRLKVRPITAFGIAVIAFSLAFGLGGVVLPKIFPWVKVNNSQFFPSPTLAPEILKDTALKGTLAKTNSNPTRFYLVTTSTEAVTLEVPDGIDLITLVGKRILAVGSYDSKNKILEVEDIQDLEVLSTTPVPIPTSTMTPKPIETPTPTYMSEPSIVPRTGFEPM